MICDAVQAQLALKMIDEAHKLLMDSLELVRVNCSVEEYEAYRWGIAHVTGPMFFFLMEPIYCQHPSLAPLDAPLDFRERWAKMGSQAEP